MSALVITGFPRQAAYLSRLLNEHAAGNRAVHYPYGRLQQLRAAAHAASADASITFGGPKVNALIARICEMRNRPVIVLWAGSDVLEIAKTPFDLAFLRLQNIIHWAVAPHLVDELAALGIDARYVPIAHAEVPHEPAALPPTFTVLTYLPKPRRDFYGQALVWEAARALPDARFIAVGHGEPEPNAPANVEYVGEIRDVDARIDASSVLLRCPEHDGLAAMVVETLARGRHVVWSYPFPGVIHVRSHADAIAALRKLQQAHTEQRLSLNEAGMRHVAHAHNPQDIARGVMDAIQAAVEAAHLTPTRNPLDRRLAISGERAASAHVAMSCRKHAKALRGTLLATDTVGDVLVSAFDILRSDVWYTVGEATGPRLFEWAAFLSQKRRIHHWLGADIDALHGDGRSLQRLRSKRYRHFAQNAEVATRLYARRLRARVIPLEALSLVQALESACAQRAATANVRIPKRV